MEFVALEQDRQGQGAIMRQQAIAQMQLALGEARGHRQEAGHGMLLAFGIDERTAEHHVTAALAIDQAAARRRFAQPGEEG